MTQLETVKSNEMPYVLSRFNDTRKTHLESPQPAFEEEKTHLQFRDNVGLLKFLREISQGEAHCGN